MYCLIVYPVLAILCLALFYSLKPQLAWISIPCAVIIELFLYWENFSYYEARGLMILLTVMQIVIMAIILSVLRRRGIKKQFCNDNI